MCIIHYNWEENLPILFCNLSHCYITMLKIDVVSLHACFNHLKCLTGFIETNLVGCLVLLPRIFSYLEQKKYVYHYLKVILSVYLNRFIFSIVGVCLYLY